jgi:photosystem II stability/assembly factor-like uncharacterized protein
MKHLTAPAFSLVLLACSSTVSSSSSGDGGPNLGDGGEGADAGAAGDDASTGDSNTDASPSYEQSVLASSWVKLASAPSAPAGAKQDDIFFVNPSLGFLASGPTESIWKTTDGGATWAKAFTHKGTYFRAVLFVDDNHGFAGNLGTGLDPSISDATLLYETKDGGGTWSPVTSIAGPAASGVCNLTAIDAQHLVAAGRANGPANMLVSSDGGASWTSLDLSSEFSMVIDARFVSPTDGILVGMSTAAGVCSVQHTSDGGKTFQEVFASKTPNSLCWKVSFPSTDVGYVAIQDTTGGPGSFAKTTDGGKTWTELPLPKQSSATAPYPAIGIGFITDNVGWVSPEDSALPTYRTADGGKTWTVDPALKSPINRFRFVDKNTAYAVGGSVWKLTISGT